MRIFFPDKLKPDVVIESIYNLTEKKLIINGGLSDRVERQSLMAQP